MSGDLLAQLLAQGAERGADIATLRAIAEEAGELGATRALTRLGLADQSAPADVAALRVVLLAGRAAKRAAWGTLAGGCCALLLAGLAIKLGFGEWLR